MYNHRGQPTGTNHKPLPQSRFRQSDGEAMSATQARSAIVGDGWAPPTVGSEGVRYFEGATDIGRNTRVSRDNQYITSTRGYRVFIHHVPSNQTASVPVAEYNPSARKAKKVAKRYVKSGIVNFDDKNS